MGFQQVNKSFSKHSVKNRSSGKNLIFMEQKFNETTLKLTKFSQKLGQKFCR